MTWTHLAHLEILCLLTLDHSTLTGPFPAHRGKFVITVTFTSLQRCSSFPPPFSPQLLIDRNNPANPLTPKPVPSLPSYVAPVLPCSASCPSFHFPCQKADSAERQLVNRSGIFPWNWRVLGSTEGPSTLKVIHPLKGMLRDDGKHIGIVEALCDSKGRHPGFGGMTAPRSTGTGVPNSKGITLVPLNKWF